MYQFAGIIIVVPLVITIIVLKVIFVFFDEYGRANL
jgi:uncharacterized membrane protein